MIFSVKSHFYKMVEILTKVILLALIFSVKCQQNMDKGLSPTSADSETGLNCQGGLSPNGDLPNATIETLVKNAGYNFTKYELITEDGYILSLFRIFKENVTRVKTTPVFFMHGFMGTEKDWVINDKDKVLAYLLVEEGWDVFLGSNRGTPQSKGHKSLNPKNDSDYWEFSYVEYAKYDDPAFLQKIEEITGQGQVYWIGHSLGSKQFFTWLALDPKNCGRIKGMWALAPVAYLSNARSPLIRKMLMAYKLLEGTIAIQPNMEFDAASRLWNTVKDLCQGPDAGQEGCQLCDNVMMEIGGFNWKQVNKPWHSLALNSIPVSTSLQNVVHLGQEMYSGLFSHFDYGAVINLIKYGFPYLFTPPQFHLSGVKEESTCGGKVNLLYSDNDYLSDTKDVLKLREELGEQVVRYFLKVEDPEWNHFDFLWAKDVDKFVNTLVLAMLNEYEAE